MEFEDEVTIQTSSDRLWELVSDPEVLVTCVPGAKEVEKLSETKYKGVIERGIAGISLELDGEVEMTELNPPNNLTAVATGQDSRTNSRMDATATMNMSETDDGQATVLSYHIDMDFTGRLATLGARIVKRKINKDIKEFFDNLKEYAQEDQATQ